MKPNADDDLDRLLAEQTLRPDASCVDALVARTQEEARLSEGAFDDALEVWLATAELEPRIAWTESTLRRMKEEEARTWGVPNWILALGSIAACFVVGAICFATLFLAVPHSAPDSLANASAGDRGPPVVSHAESLLQKLPPAEEEPAITSEELMAYEDLVLLNDTLHEAWVLADDQQTLETVDAFFN